MQGLIRKYYLRSEDGRRAGGVYLWETRAAAEAVYNGEWKARVKTLYGSEPEISWFDTPVIVDNEAGGIIRPRSDDARARLIKRPYSSQRLSIANCRSAMSRHWRDISRYLNWTW